MSYWQNPFVSLLKSYRPNEKSKAQGAVRTKTNNGIRSQVWSISGDISAKNFIQIPANGHVSLNGRFFYLAFRPTPLKYFVFHIDIASEENFTCRVSFSNMYKCKRLAANMAQIPFVIPPKRSTVADLLGNSGCPGRAPEISGWLMFVVDLKQLLRLHFGRSFSHVRQVQLCSDMTVKGVYTSDTEYDPKISIKQARAEGFRNISDNLAPMPREMNFVVERNDFWDRKYQMVRFPTEEYDYEIAKKSDLLHKQQQRCPRRSAKSRNSVKTRPVSSDIRPNSSIQFREVPPIAKVEVASKFQSEDADTQIEPVTNLPKGELKSYEPGKKKGYAVAATAGFTTIPVDDGEHLIYGSGKNFVRMRKSTLEQECLVGSQTDVIRVIRMAGLLISSEASGELRIWERSTTVSIISTSIVARYMDTLNTSLVIAGKCTKLGSSYNSVALWSLSDPLNPTEICKGSTDQQIKDLVVISKREPLQFATGGDRGVRIWRTRHRNHLRSAAVNLGTQSTSVVNSISFFNNFIYAGTKKGALLQIDPEKMTLVSCHQLLYNHKPHEVTAILARDYLLVGTSDGLLRSWSNGYEKVSFELDLGYKIAELVPTESENEILVISDAKSIGLLDVAREGYRTLARFHRSRVLFCDFSGDLIATASRSDVRVWNCNNSTLVQLLELELSQQLTALAIGENTLGLGFASGQIEIYNISDDNGEHVGTFEFHEGAVKTLQFSKNKQLFTLGSEGDIACFSIEQFTVLRSITDGGNRHSTNKLLLSPDGKFMTTLCRSSRSKIQLYSPFLDQIAQIEVRKNEGKIINWCFLTETVLIAVLEDFSAFQIAISKNKKIQRQKIIHYATDADALLLHSSSKIFTLSYAKGSLKLWSPTMKTKSDDVDCPERVNAIAASEYAFIAAGDQLVLFQLQNNPKLKPVDNQVTSTALYESISPTDITETPLNLLRALDLDETHDIVKETVSSSVSDLERDVPSPIPRISNPFEDDYDDLNVTPDDDSIERDTTAFSHSKSQYFPPVPPINPVIFGGSSL